MLIVLQSITSQLSSAKNLHPQTLLMGGILILEYGLVHNPNVSIYLLFKNHRSPTKKKKLTFLVSIYYISFVGLVTAKKTLKVYPQFSSFSACSAVKLLPNLGRPVGGCLEMGCPHAVYGTLKTERFD